MISKSRMLFARAAVMALFSGFATSPAQAADAQVAIDNFTFNPMELHVKAGTKVTWTNRDDIPHTVADPPTFKSKPLDTEETFSFTFTTPGSFKYFCSLHPHMTGVIVVEPASPGSAMQ